MRENFEPLRLPPHQLISESQCPSTIAGWLWYCDEHDTHGQADSEDEAHVLADTHEEWWAAANPNDEDCCTTVVWERGPRHQMQ